MTSTPVLAFDLVRHPRGARLAHVLRHALAADATQVLALARAHERATAHGATALAGTAAPETAPGTSGVPLAGVALAGGETEAARHLLETGLLGDLDALLAFVRDQVLGDSWTRGTPLHPAARQASSLDGSTRARAAQLVAEAVVAAWTGAPPPGEHRAGALVADAWAPVAHEHPAPPVPVGPGTAVLRGLLRRLRRLDEDDLRRLRHAASRLSSPVGAWAQDVHSSSWALHAADRTEAAACVQLEAAEVLAARRASVPDLAAGAWLVVSGCLHAVAADGAMAGGAPAVRAWEEALGRPVAAAGLPRPRPTPAEASPPDPLPDGGSGS